jgi:hypothetical protein
MLGSEQHGEAGEKYRIRLNGARRSRKTLSIWGIEIDL